MHFLWKVFKIIHNENICLCEGGCVARDDPFIYNTGTITRKRFLFNLSLTITGISLILVAIFFIRNRLAGSDISPIQNVASVLGQATGRFPTIEQQTPTPTVTPLPPTPTPTVYENSVSFISVPSDMLEGDRAAYTWTVNGPEKTIHKTTVYYGTESTPGVLTTAANPQDTRYTQALPDFMQGDYRVPLRFIAGIPIATSGRVYFRGYALIDGKNYWTDERSFAVAKKQKNVISIINKPVKFSPNTNISFTWDVGGPAATFSFTTIVAGKESKKGVLDESVTVGQTPYKVIVPDFTNGSYSVPIRFVGNASIAEAGVYYFRAIAYINGKNIWTDEYFFTVE